MPSIFIFLLFVSVTPFFCPVSLFAEDIPRKKLPVYEYGVMALGAHLPHYRGSDEYSTYAFPLPYFVYRGEKIKANRDGVRGIFMRYNNFETAVSLSGNPPVSDENEAREGMAELDGIIELGPAMRYYFYEYGERDACYLQYNVRAAFSIGFDDGLDISSQGFISDLSLIYKNSSLFEAQHLRYHFSTGPQFADSRFHSYFYDVNEDDVTVTRERYSAGSGYGGWQLSASILKELTSKIWLGLYARWMNSDGVSFEDSPLVEETNNYVVGSMFIWKFGESEELEP